MTDFTYQTSLLPPSWSSRISMAQNYPRYGYFLADGEYMRRMSDENGWSDEKSISWLEEKIGHIRKMWRLQFGVELTHTLIIDYTIDLDPANQPEYWADQSTIDQCYYTWMYHIKPLGYDFYMAMTGFELGSNVSRWARRHGICTMRGQEAGQNPLPPRHWDIDEHLLIHETTHQLQGTHNNDYSPGQDGSEGPYLVPGIDDINEPGYMSYNWLNTDNTPKQFHRRNIDDFILGNQRNINNGNPEEQTHLLVGEIFEPGARDDINIRGIGEQNKPPDFPLPEENIQNCIDVINQIPIHGAPQEAQLGMQVWGMGK